MYSWTAIGDSGFSVAVIHSGKSFRKVVSAVIKYFLVLLIKGHRWPPYGYGTGAENLVPKSVGVWFSIPWRPYRASFHFRASPLQFIA